MMPSQPLVSIVTPVYNAEKFLAECVESVLAQTYENWGYVIVNNRSTDRSLEIAHQYARQDPRIRVHNNERFLGLIQNWNHTLRQISPASKYCKVVHADDWLFPHCLAEMVEVAEAHPSVGLVGAYRLDDVWVNCDGLVYPSTVVSGREICQSSLLGGPYLFGSPTSLLIRTDLIRARESFYNESHIHADTEVCYELLQETDFGFVHQVLTYTRRHHEAASSLTRRLNTHILGELAILKTYGPVYLTGEEYRRRWREAMRNYYRVLAKSLLQRRGEEFWDFHRKGIEGLGSRLSLTGLITASSLEVARFLLCPARIIRWAAGLRNRRDGQGSDFRRRGVVAEDSNRSVHPS